MRLVVDTNVLVSALLKPKSVPDLAFDAMWQSGTVLVDARLVAEYAAVLERPKFRAASRARIAEILGIVRDRAEDVGAVPVFAGAMTDDGDRMFVEVALAGRADAIVTGNIRHYPDDLGFEVLPPATFLARLEHGATER
jgi:putative PIN family toxin of toxin-antitoxin system